MFKKYFLPFVIGILGVVVYYGTMFILNVALVLLAYVPIVNVIILFVTKYFSYFGTSVIDILYSICAAFAAIGFASLCTKYDKSYEGKCRKRACIVSGIILSIIFIPIMICSIYSEGMSFEVLASLVPYPFGIYFVFTGGT